MSRVLRAGRVLMAATKSKAKAASSGSAATTTTAAAEEGAKKKTPGIMKPLPVSAAMRKFAGIPEISRAEAVKKIWEHIKLNQLQDPKNRREIHCDEQLKSLFEGREKVQMLEIARLISCHFVKTI